jgi:hypothetical protein
MSCHSSRLCLAKVPSTTARHGVQRVDHSANHVMTSTSAESIRRLKGIIHTLRGVYDPVTTTPQNDNLDVVMGENTPTRYVAALLKYFGALLMCCIQVLKDIDGLHRSGPSSSFHRELPDWGNRRGGACSWGTLSLRRQHRCCHGREHSY